VEFGARPTMWPACGTSTTIGSMAGSRRFVASNNLMTPVIVEVKNLEEFNIAKQYDIIDRILIDNFKPNDIVALLQHNTTNKIIEASGGINESNIVSYAETGINFISLGDLTHHVNSVDISLKIE
jgi:nicotinate-nucleotide pyrophosphorylase (carboxylating)